MNHEGGFTDSNSEVIEDHRGDGVPSIEELIDGSTRITTRVIRTPVKSLKSKQLIREQVDAQSNAIDAQIQGATGRVLNYPNYKNDSYDYHDMMPDIGSPASIEAEPISPPLVIANVRHLVHENNVVTAETASGFTERANNLIDDLDITPNTLVYVISSPAANFEAGTAGSDASLPEVHSRTEATADVIRQVLDQRDIRHTDNSLGEGGPMGTPIDKLRRSLDEFQVSDNALYEESLRQAKANMVAKRAGEDLPYPDAPSVPPTVYASQAPSLQDLELRTGMTEVSSASVAHGMEGIDLLEDHFLKQGNVPADVDKIVVILARHGQFCTNVSEALMDATDGAHPIVFAENGGYAIIQACQTAQGEVVEDYIYITGDRTGMQRR